LARWHDVRAHSALATQVAAANDVEGLARRLVATAAASPRLRNNATVLSALAQFLADPSHPEALGFNQKVASYEHERRGPVRSVVASVLGDGAIPVLDTTATTSSASTATTSS
ncbi:MAG: hypothetical protein M3Q30_02620, partial [Actinomycetota bacterium]|nr:hypothetical protein [Actinomycetota bacterium]